MKQKRGITASRVVITSLLVNLSDIFVNVVVAILTGSVVIRSQMLQGLADFIGSVFLYVGVQRARKKPDIVHPFGFGKELYFWTLLSAIVMAVLAASFSFYFGFTRVLNPQPIDNIALAVGVLIFATITNAYALSLSYKRLMKGKKFSSLYWVFWHTHLVETKNTLVQDTLGTTASIVGLISLLLYAITGWTLFDAFGAMAIGILLATLSFILIHGLRDFVIGKRASDQVEKRIRKEVLQVIEVQDILDLRTMMIGSDKILVNIEVHLIDNLNTDQIEKIIDRIKLEVQDEVPSVTHIQVELETPDV